MAPPKSTFVLADEATNGLVTMLKELMDRPLSENVKQFQKQIDDGSTTVLNIYELANMLSLIARQAHFGSHRVNAIANNIKIEEVG